MFRESQYEMLSKLADQTTGLDEEIVYRMHPDIRVAAGSLRLGLLSVLVWILRWPDWAMPALFTRGFRVAGLIEALVFCS